MILVSLHTKSSSMFHGKLFHQNGESGQWRHYHPCSNELESCLPTTFCSTEETISRFENCLKMGCCPHVVPLEHNDASRTVNGFHWIHLAIILNKFTIIKELAPFFLKTMSYLADNAGYYETIKMNIVDVLRAIVHTNRMYYGVTTGFDLAFDSPSYESIDFFVNYHRNPWESSTTLKLKDTILSGNIDFYI